MALGEIVPWKWGGLRRSGRDERSYAEFQRDIDSMHRELDRLFDGLISGGIGSSLLSEAWSREGALAQMDMTEDDKAFQVNIDLPGLDEKKEEKEIKVKQITVKAA